MKLKKAHPKDWVDQVPISFWTMGPITSDYRDEVQDLFRKYFGRAIKNLIVSAEISDQGYNHVHVGMELFGKMSYGKAHKHIQKELLRICGPRESGENYSCTVNKVPSTERIHGEQLYGFAIVEKYLQNPTKVKTVGDVEMVCLDEGWNYWHDIEKAFASVKRIRESMNEPGISKSERHWREVQADNHELTYNYVREHVAKHIAKFGSIDQRTYCRLTMAIGYGVDTGQLRPKKFNF